MLLLIITPRKFLDSNMDSGEIVYASVEEVIGKTGKSLSLLALMAGLLAKTCRNSFIFDPGGQEHRVLLAFSFSVGQILTLARLFV